MAEFLLLARGASLGHNLVPASFIGPCQFVFILLIAANCTVLGVPPLNVDRRHTLLGSLLSGAR